MKRSFIVASAVAGACLVGSALADTYDEELEFIETSGSQWVDTGLVPDRLKTRITASYAILERPEGPVGLFGVLRAKLDPVDADPGWEAGWITAFSARVSPTLLLADWTGGYSDQASYTYQYAVAAKYDEECWQATVWYNGEKRGGYYGPDDPAGNYVPSSEQRPFSDVQTLYIGNVNNADGSLLTEAGKMPKVRWYGFKVVTGGVTVGDFIPVLRDGVAGLFDKVTETFFPSRGEAAFIAPARFVWKGGGETKSWSDKTNWEGAEAPSKGSVVVIPAGKEALIDNSADLAVANSLSQIKIADPTATLCISNIAVNSRLSVPLSGTGRFLHLDSGDGSADDEYHHLAIDGNNSGFAGVFAITNCGLLVANENALGGKNGGTVYCHLKGRQRLTLDGGTFYNLFYVGGTEYSTSFLIAQDDSDLMNDVHLTSSVGLHAGGHQFRFHGKVYRDDLTSTISIASTLVSLLGGVDFSGSALSLYCGTVLLGGPEGGSDLGRMFCDECVRFAATNVFPEGYSDFRFGNGATCLIDLNGFDQRVGWMYMGGGTTQPPRLTSATPAKLAIEGWGIGDGIWTGNGDTISGCATLELKSSVMALADMESSTAGGLSVSGGRMTVKSSARFPNLTELKACGNGTLVVEGAQLGTATNMVVSVLDNGVLEIADGVTIAAQTARVSDEKWLSEGVYGGPDSAAPVKLPCLSGTGLLKVKSYGGKKGFILLFR